MTGTQETNGSWQGEMTDTDGMQQQAVYIGLENPWEHVHQELSTAGLNNLSVGSGRSLAILGGTDSDTPRHTPQKKKTVQDQRNKQKK
jgi:hypothetical protein